MFQPLASLQPAPAHANVSPVRSVTGISGISYTQLPIHFMSTSPGKTFKGLMMLADLNPSSVDVRDEATGKLPVPRWLLRQEKVRV